MSSLLDSVLEQLNFRYEKLKKKRQISRRKLAAAIGCSPGQVTFLLNGDRPLTIEWLEKLSEGMGVRADDVLSDAFAATSDTALRAKVNDLSHRGFRREYEIVSQVIDRALIGGQSHFKAMMDESGAAEGLVLYLRDGSAHPLFRSFGLEEAQGLAEMWLDRAALPKGWETAREESSHNLVAAVLRPKSDAWREVWFESGELIQGNLEQIPKLLRKTLTRKEA